MLHPRISRRWDKRPCVVAATGPSLSAEQAARAHALAVPTIAVQDAHALLPWADVLYGCDEAWWNAHAGVPEFGGERWSSHEVPGPGGVPNDKIACAEAWGIELVQGRDREGFSLDPARIHYGGNSGFQAVNLALLFGCSPILLIGFDMCGIGHFFGDHPARVTGGAPPQDASRFIGAFNTAAKRLPSDVMIVNCTPNSALHCFRRERLEDALALVA